MDSRRTYAEVASPERRKNNPVPAKPGKGEAEKFVYSEWFPPLQLKYPDRDIQGNRLPETTAGKPPHNKNPTPGNQEPPLSKPRTPASKAVILKPDTCQKLPDQGSRKLGKCKNVNPPKMPKPIKIPTNTKGEKEGTVNPSPKPNVELMCPEKTNEPLEKKRNRVPKKVPQNTQSKRESETKTPSTTETIKNPESPTSKQQVSIFIPDKEKLIGKRHSNEEYRVYYYYPYARALECPECDSTRHLYYIPGQMDASKINSRINDHLKHIRDKHTTNTVTTRWLVCRLCKECSTENISPKNKAVEWWNKHLRAHHHDTEITFIRERSAGKFTCTKCNLNFQIHYALQFHECPMTPVEPEEQPSHDTPTTQNNIPQPESVPEGFRCLFYRPEDPVDWLEKLYTDDAMNWALRRVGKHLDSQVIPSAVWTGTENKANFGEIILPTLHESKYCFIPICEHYHWKLVIITNVDSHRQAVFLDPKHPPKTPDHIIQAFAKINVIWKDNAYLYNQIPVQGEFDNTECGPLVCALAFVFEQLENNVQDLNRLSANVMRCTLQNLYMSSNTKQSPQTTILPPAPPPTTPTTSHIAVPSALQCFFLEKGLNAWYTETAMRWAIKQIIPFPSADVTLMREALEGKESLKSVLKELRVVKTILIPHCINRMWCAIILYETSTGREAKFIHHQGLKIPDEIQTLVESETQSVFSRETYPPTPQNNDSNDPWQHSGIKSLHLILEYDNSRQNPPIISPTLETLKVSLRDTIIEKLTKGSRALASICESDDKYLDERRKIPDLLGISVPKPDNTKSGDSKSADDKRKKNDFRQMKDATKRWFNYSKEIYIQKGRTFPHFEWLVNQTGLLISHATRDRIVKHQEVFEAPLPANPTRNPSIYHPKNKKPENSNRKKKYPDIVTHYAADPSDAFHTITDPPSTACNIPTKILEEYFSKINDEPENDPELIRKLAEILPEFEIPPTFTDPFTTTEVEYLMKKTKKDSAAGNDGLTYRDWQSIDTNHSMMLFIVNECAHHELIPVKWKSSKCTLIYKKGPLSDPENWRPITLLPTIHKIYAGLWDKRIAKIPDIFSEEQCGFQDETGTGDNIIILRTALDHARANDHNTAFAWIDIRNAFGSITHETIHIVMEQMGMPLKLRNIIKDMYNGCTTVYISTEGYTNPVELQVGTKQGDTISPTLFNLVLEILIRRHLARSEGYKFLGHTIKLLAFADDIVVVAKDKDTLERELNIMAIEAKVLNLEFKPAKCASLVFAGGSANAFAVTKILGEPIPALNRDNHYPYLGVPMGFSSQFPMDELTEEINNKALLLVKRELTVNQKLDAIKKFLITKLTYILSYGTPKIDKLQKLDTLVKERIKDAANLPFNAVPTAYLYSPREKACLGFISIMDMSRILLITTFLNILWHHDESVRNLFCSYLQHHTNKDNPNPCENLRDFLEYISNGKLSDGLRLPPQIGRICLAIYYYTTSSQLLEYVKFEIENDDVILNIKEKISGKITKITRRQHKKCSKLIKQAVQRATFDQWITKRYVNDATGAIYHASKQHESRYFLYNKPPYLSAADQKFIHYARLCLTELNASELRKIINRREAQDLQCRRCTSGEAETLVHVLNACERHLSTTVVDRHNSVQDLLMQAWELGEKSEYDSSVTTGIPGTGFDLKPDLVLRGKHKDSQKEEILIIDVTCPFEKYDYSLDQAHQRKMNKYQPLADKLNENPNIDASAYSVVIGSRGTFRKENYETFKAMGIPDDIQLLLAQLMVRTTISWSRFIYWSHIIGSNYTLNSKNKPPKTPRILDFRGPNTAESVRDDDYEPPTKIRKSL